VPATHDQTTPRTPTTIRGAPRPGEAVTPQSWRVACSLPPAPAPVSDAVLDACRESLVARVQPRGGNRVARPPTDRRPEFERETARARARQEYLRAPGPVGGSNAGPSDAPGSNFGMGSLTDSVIPLTSTTSGGTTVLPRRTQAPPPPRK
jgi:hypothetical protein